MAFLKGISGHDKDSDQLHAGPPNPWEATEANGASKSLQMGSEIAPPSRGADYDPRNWGGHGYEASNGWYIMGTSGADRDVDRYRDMAARRQSAVQLDRTHEAESRGHQMGALARLRSAAMGGAPSRAAAIGQMQSDAAARSGTAGVAGARSPGAGISALRNAMSNYGSSAAAVNQSAMDMRAAETARDQAAFANGANTTRGQDVTVATTNAGLRATQNQLNDANEQYYEKMGWDTRNAQLNANLERKRQDEQAAAAKRQQRAAEDAQNEQVIKDYASLGIGGFLGALSDERAKTNVTPIGGLSRLVRR